MFIRNNIVRQRLSRVYVISGSACAGKTTVSRMLAEKHGFARYDMDAMYERHRAMADPKHQPMMCRHMEDFHAQWTKPAWEHAQLLMGMIAEQSEMVVLDLMEAARERPVVADVIYAPIYSRSILSERQFVFLTADKSELRRTYFHRPEKQSFYEFVQRQPLAQTYFENIFAGLELTHDLELQEARRSGLPILERTAGDTPETMLARVEHLFGLDA